MNSSRMPRRRSAVLGLALVAAFTALAVLATPALAAGGAITGKVEASPAKYLDETVVYLKEVKGTFKPGTFNMDQKGMRFIPHVLAVTKGDTVEFLNHDTVNHNVYSSDNETYNLGTFKPGEKRSYTFKGTGMYAQLCSLHPEMLGFIFVGQNPYAAVVAKSGEFHIKDVPPGTYQLAVWNSHLKAPEQSVTITEGKTVTSNVSLHR